MAKQKIAVLGGGAGSMTAVYGLTSQPGWADRYDITVYQLGWRLGGKGASGRYQTPDGRYANVEHGLHVFGGFYHNAFGMLRQVYEAWPCVPDAVPIPWEQAFLPHDLIHLGNDTKQGWGFAGIKFPHLPGDLGIGGVELTPFAIIATVIAWIQEVVTGHAILRGGRLTPDADLHETLFERIEEAPIKAFAIATDDLIKALELIRDVPVADIAWDGIIALLDAAIIAAKVLRALFPPDKNQLDLLGGLEIMLVTLKGMIIDDVLILGFDVINHMEFTDWLKSYGLSDDIAHSAMVRAPYDYAFAYELGDPEKPNIAAGVCLRGMMRLVLTYTGSIFWHLNGGMGEIVFTPLYEVLKERGVKFQFFTRVESLILSDDGQHIAQIGGKIQAVPNKGPYDYDPLVYYAAGNRKFWPLQPDFSQLVNGSQLEWIGTGFENYWLCPNSDTPFTLTRGVDFDLVVLGISVGALSVICADLAKKSPAWNKMLTTQQAVPTYGIQYWMKPSVPELGWDRGETILTAYQEPMSSWGDMSFLLKFETQAPDHTKPQSLAYFCGPMKQAPFVPVPPAPEFPITQQRDAVQAMSDWADIAIQTLWPNAGPGPGINPDLVYQTVVKANIDPSELYVLSPADTIKDRFKAGDSGIEGLYLAGDWLKTGLDAGAFESAVMSGLQCAQAISGIPIHVYGATDFPKYPASPNNRSLPMSSLPDYVEVPGNVVPRIPYEAAAATMQSGFVKGDFAKLQASVDTILNGPAAGRLNFVVVTDMVLVTMLYCPKMTSADPVDHLMGSESEGDIGFWTLVWGGPGTDPVNWSLRWLPIYLFVDSGTAMAAGREVFGFPKSLGIFNRATHNSDDGRVSVDTLLFKTYGVDQQAVTTQLFEIAYGTGASKGGLFSGLEHALSEIGDLMVKGLDAVTHNGLDLSKLKLPMVGMPMVFLKQFRDVAVPNKACYQAIVEATVESTKIYEFGMLSGSYQLNFIDCASYPINADMGITSGQELIFPMWLIQDFSCGFGTIL